MGEMGMNEDILAKLKKQKLQNMHNRQITFINRKHASANKTRNNGNEYI